MRDRIDPARVHFVGKIPYPQFVALMQVSRAHAYLTYPFVLSWSMIEAMAAGCHIVASNTAPVAEAITDGVNGTLVDFFDVAAWSKALITALAEPERFAPLRVAARKTAQDRYDLRRIFLPQMMNFIESFGPQLPPNPSPPRTLSGAYAIGGGRFTQGPGSSPGEPKRAGRPCVSTP